MKTAKQAQKRGGFSLKWKKTAVFVAQLIVIITLVAVLETWAIYGFLLFILVIACNKIYRSRDSIRVMQDQIETLFFGKPLKKEYWDKGEFKKRRRIKIVWKKNTK